MKNRHHIIFFTLILMIATSQRTYGNMAAPIEADIGSSITFEQNEAISVLSEVLDITVDGSQADIVATYTMTNTSEQSVSIQTMFLSPNIKNSNTKVLVNGQDTAFRVETFALNYDTKIETKDWQYVVLSSRDPSNQNQERAVDTISFELEFVPKETYEVMVSYRYQLGGYPDVDFNVKQGHIEYYLAPATMWKDFSNLTINLNLDENMPIIARSNLNFNKVGPRRYQYISDVLPEENLRMTIDENWWQNIFSTLRSPYLAMTLKVMSPFILIIVTGGGLLVWRSVKRKKSTNFKRKED